MGCIRPAQQMGRLGPSLLSLVAESTFQEFEGLRVGWGRQGGHQDGGGGQTARAKVLRQLEEQRWERGRRRGAARAERLAHWALQAVVSVPQAVRTLSEVGSDSGWLFEGSWGSEEKLATACSARH